MLALAVLAGVVPGGLALLVPNQWKSTLFVLMTLLTIAILLTPIAFVVNLIAVLKAKSLVPYKLGFILSSAEFLLLTASIFFLARLKEM